MLCALLLLLLFTTYDDGRRFHGLARVPHVARLARCRTTSLCVVVEEGHEGVGPTKTAIF